MNDSLFDRFLRLLGRSQFLTYSALLHLLLIAVIGTRVAYEQLKEDDDGIQGQAGSFMETPPVNVPPPTEQEQSSDSATQGGSQIGGPTISENPIRVITTGTPGNDLIPVIPILAGPGGPTPPTPKPPGALPQPDVRNLPTGIPRDQIVKIQKFTENWRVGPANTTPGNSRFKFQAYVAKYAGGDWNSTHQVSKSGDITRGALPNLCYMMKIWSKDKVDAEAMTKPLNLASGEIFDVRPPFIFFTGTRDFVLSDAEITNLRKYLQVGGAIWGDSSLPGRNSRFDLAFRREMKRVLDDKSIEFEALPSDHPLFTTNFKLGGAPQGLNFYQEPVYAMRIYGEISVLYTANDYGDMMTVGLNEEGKIESRRDINNQLVAIDHSVWDNRETYYRNLSEPALVDTYEFSINTVYYLLTRWENKLRGTAGR